MVNDSDEISVREAAEILEVSSLWVNRAIIDGKLTPTNKISSVLKRPRAWKLSRKAIIAYKERADKQQYDKERSTKKHAPMSAVAS